MHGRPFTVAFNARVTFVASDCFYLSSLHVLSRQNGDRGRPEGVVGKIRLDPENFLLSRGERRYRSQAALIDNELVSL